jgi:hypothetical protein
VREDVHGTCQHRRTAGMEITVHQLKSARE